MENNEDNTFQTLDPLGPYKDTAYDRSSNTFFANIKHLSIKWKKLIFSVLLLIISAIIFKVSFDSMNTQRPDHHFSEYLLSASNTYKNRYLTNTEQLKNDYYKLYESLNRPLQNDDFDSFKDDLNTSILLIDRASLPEDSLRRIEHLSILLMAEMIVREKFFQSNETTGLSPEEIEIKLEQFKKDYIKYIKITAPK